MGKKKKNVPQKETVLEFKVSMHCNACERTVAKAISKCQGVEKFTTDMKNHRVVVTGRIDPKKVLKKLKQKTGKRVEALAVKEDMEENGESGPVSEPVLVQPIITDIDGCIESEEAFMMFSDENPNACAVM
ncbi:hypothetical protein L6164_012621 [Bauhinia variegata]|uniref:Uncharacterized protein n=1 Tax=Bauhinia variegata TaxID=167791 RepID=A0ACB9P9U1_BAUVA|nr:hypothetical protein L6164_012621 [Bauhinia variegata]